MMDKREIISGLHASYGLFGFQISRFPDWCNDEGYQMLHDKFCQTARLVAPQNKKREARLSIYQRQPVNIAMDTSGTNWKAFEKLQRTLLTATATGATLGRRWTESYYTTHYRETNGRLAVNVAVYCETPVYKTQRNNEVTFYHEELPKLTANGYKRARVEDPSTLPFRTIRVLNLIGLGFDDPKQPDHKAFAKFAKDEKNANLRLGAIKWLQPHVTSQLQKVEAVLNWAHTSNKPIRYMHLPEVGCGAFVGKMPIRKVWVELSTRAVSKWKDKWPTLRRVQTDNMYVGAFGGMHSRWVDLDEEYGLQNCLFVNAWDPHSFVGNGNLADHSLDGWYGRFTAMAVLAWPGTNPYLWRDSHFIDSTPVEGSSEETRASRNFEAQKKSNHWIEDDDPGEWGSSEEDNGTLQQTATKETQMIRKPRPKPKPKRTTKTKKTGNGDSKYEEVRSRGAKILQTSCTKLGQSKFCLDV